MKKKKLNNPEKRPQKMPNEFLPIFICFLRATTESESGGKKEKKYVTISIGRAKKEKRTPGESESPILGLAEWVFLYFLKDFSQCTQFEVW